MQILGCARNKKLEKQYCQLVNHGSSSEGLRAERLQYATEGALILSEWHIVRNYTEAQTAVRVEL